MKTRRALHSRRRRSQSPLSDFCWGESSASFSLRGFVLARIKTRRLKPALLNALKLFFLVQRFFLRNFRRHANVPRL